MRIDVLTLFPEMFPSVLESSIMHRAISTSALQVYLTDIRDFTFTKNRQVDDYPYGGEAGMVIKPEPLWDTIDYVKEFNAGPVIYFTPQGKVLTQEIVKDLACHDGLILLCGHYKDIDNRIRESVVTEELSIGDYVLSGGELPALVLIDAIARLQPGVLSDIESAESDSFENKILGYPYYTRPKVFRGMSVPAVLLSGHHERVKQWRDAQALKITKLRRPDLLDE